MTLVHLPNGPTAVFRMSGVKLPHEIHNHATRTSHNPELILTNFKTPIGKILATMLRGLFPKNENKFGRQVATWQNQKDFIFFRQYRYMFEGKEKAELQEIGPKFTLKLQKLIDGLYSTDNPKLIWSYKDKKDNFKRCEL
ncbi:Ribosome production factor 1 [Thelohanellus kitauei]|uniref:Ribosome production factor 1 n=1 Tax=Thelohanellus kitauei TaxID=669202 RepID=A0A0C2MLT3_THEKT|nr:Ribosome production factor 1 [Thelohanellus kitauei]